MGSDADRKGCSGQSFMLGQTNQCSLYIMCRTGDIELICLLQPLSNHKVMKFSGHCRKMCWVWNTSLRSNNRWSSEAGVSHLDSSIVRTALSCAEFTLRRKPWELTGRYCLSIWTLERSPYFLSHVPKLGILTQNEYFHAIKCVMMYVRLPPFAHKQKWRIKCVNVDSVLNVKTQPVFPASVEALHLVSNAGTWLPSCEYCN